MALSRAQEFQRQCLRSSVLRTLGGFCTSRSRGGGDGSKALRAVAEWTGGNVFQQFSVLVLSGLPRQPAFEIDPKVLQSCQFRRTLVTRKGGINRTKKQAVAKKQCSTRPLQVAVVVNSRLKRTNSNFRTRAEEVLIGRAMDNSHLFIGTH